MLSQHEQSSSGDGFQTIDPQKNILKGNKNHNGHNRLVLHYTQTPSELGCEINETQSLFESNVEIQTPENNVELWEGNSFSDIPLIYNPSPLHYETNEEISLPRHETHKDDLGLATHGEANNNTSKQKRFVTDGCLSTQDPESQAILHSTNEPQGVIPKKNTKNSIVKRMKKRQRITDFLYVKENLSFCHLSKYSTNSNIFKSFQFILTGISDDVTIIRSFIKASQGVILDDLDFTSLVTIIRKNRKKKNRVILIAPHACRTRKYMLSVTLGIPLLHCDWLLSNITKITSSISFQLELNLSFAPFILPTGVDLLGSTIYYNDLLTLPNYPLDGLRFEIITSSHGVLISDEREVLGEILRALGARIVRRFQGFEGKTSPNIDCIIYCTGETADNEKTKQDLDLYKRLMIPFVKKEWVFQCCIHQRLLPFIY